MRRLLVSMLLAAVYGAQWLELGALPTWFVMLLGIVVGVPLAWLARYEQALAAEQNSFVMELMGRAIGMRLLALLFRKIMGRAFWMNSFGDQMMPVRANAKRTLLQGTAKGGVCFMGSSTFAFWSSLTDDMRPLPVYNAAFPGSTTRQQFQHVQKVVLAHDPRVVVYYCGVNDLNLGAEAEDAAVGFIEMAKLIRCNLPNTAIVYVAICITPYQVWMGQKRLSRIKKVNAYVEEFVRDQSGMHFVSTNELEFTANRSFYLADNLHLTEAGHKELGRALFPTVKRAFG